MNDVLMLLEEIKKNCQIVESGNYDKTILFTIESDCKHLIELIKLFLISERDSYYGYILMNLSIEPDCCVSSIAGIKLNSMPPVLVTNPLLLCQYNIQEIIYIICHEIDHIVLNHPAEMLKCNPTRDEELFEKFNLAADASVNDRLNTEIRDLQKDKNKTVYMSQPNGIITSNELAKIYGLKNILEHENYLYYLELILDKNKEKNVQQKKRMITSLADKRNKSQENFGDAITRYNCENIEDHDWGVDQNKMEAHEAVKELINNSYGMMSEEIRGLVSGIFTQQVSLINKEAKLPWQSLLKKYIGTISAGHRNTKTRLNRRQPMRFDLSGKITEKELKIVVAIDTSGSISNKTINAFLNEIVDIIALRKYEITIIECDSEIKRIYTIRKKTDIKNNVKGRGGTAFKPVIQYVNSNRYYRDALLIYFTDGLGEAYIEKPMTYRNLWVIDGDVNNLSVKNPHGEVVSLKE